MAQAVGGALGAVVGFSVGGGPAGAQWGWAIGSAIGASFTTIKQPRIGDLAEVRAGEGGARARVYGTFRPIGGQVVWAGKPREIRRRQRQGKGGPKVETSTILRSYAIGICEGPINGVTRIWRNNELVYDVRPTSEILAESAQWIQGKTLLLGGWDQLPHPTIEAEAGAGNAPAMRGTALLVITDEDLTDLRGAIPAYQFEVGAGAAFSFSPALVVSSPGPLSPTWDVTSGNSPPTFPTDAIPEPFPGGTQTMIFTYRRVPIQGSDSGLPKFRIVIDANEVFDSGFVESFADQTVAIRIPDGATNWLIYLDRAPATNPRFDFEIRFSSQDLQTLYPAEWAVAFLDSEIPALPVIVRKVCSDASLVSDLVDVSALPFVHVPGFATSPDYTAASALMELAKLYFFDPQDVDGVIRFVPRGGDYVAILTEDQFVDGDSEPESDTTRDSISVPRLLHLQYYDINGGQAPDKQFSERQVSPRSESPTVLSTPIVLDAETAAKAISVQHKVMEEELRGELVFGLPDSRIAFAPADVLVVQYRGRSQRCRVTKVEIMDGWQRVTAVRDRQSAYTSQVQPIPPAPVTRPPETIPGPTRFAFLDIPALTQAGDLLGYHVATSGETAGWRGAIIERQDGSAFSLLATDGTGTVMGTLTGPLPSASEWYPDETNAITVQLARSDDELASVSTAEWLGRANAAALVRSDGTAEIVQFRSVAETSEGVWRLSGLQRGRLNSGASAHPAGTTFVLLDGSLFVQTGSELLSTTLTHRAYSVGDPPTTATPQARLWTGRSQREWPPIIESATRTGDTLEVTWTPRHRFGSDENPIPSMHFEGWRVTATDGTASVSADTTGTTVTLDITGMSNPITITVQGRNRLAGLGDPATRIIT